MEPATFLSIVLWGVSFIIFFWFGRFTLNLIRQHKNINPLLYELEEAEKKKQHGEN
jgi:hypothetical protein